MTPAFCGLPSVRRRWLAAGVLGVLAAGTVAQACNVPVFRYALERWRADSYRVTVFHRGELSPAHKGLLVRLAEQQEKSLANLTVRSVEVSDVTTAEDRELVGALSDPEFPALVVQFPAALKIAGPVWSSAFDSSSVSQMLDSPVRTELVRRLVDGETAVWLLLESGHAEKDNEAARLLEEQLPRLAKELKLPELTDQPDDNLVAGTPLKLAFSVLRVPRSEAETPLIQMLLHCESDLLDRPDPMVFPVFGRGRALWPLLGAGITAENIQSSASFLVGACSCEVKELNPGFDLLLAAEWDLLLGTDGLPLPVVAPRADVGGAPELVAIPPGGGESTAQTVATAETLAAAETPAAAETVARADTASATETVAAAVPANASVIQKKPPKGSNRAIYSVLAIAGALVALFVLMKLNRARAPAV